jgi:inner membrane protein
MRYLMGLLLGCVRGLSFPFHGARAGLEDYALLAGAILGFVALTIVMFVTLRVDWSGTAAAVRTG